MLSIMREKAGSWMLKVILGIIAVVFVFWGFGTQNSGKTVKVASVNGEPISYKEYKKQYDDMVEEFRRRLGENFNEEIIKNLGLEKRALESLIERRLMISEAEKLNFQVTEEELDTNIVRTPTFQKGGRFDENTYLRVLKYARITPEAFKKMQREAMLIQKLRLFVTGSAKVSKREVKEWYKWENAEVSIDFVKFSPDAYKIAGVTTEETKAFYEKNKSIYKIEPKIKIQFIRFSPDNYQSKIDIAEEEIQEYYESNPEEFETPKTVEARHILIKVDPEASEDVVQKGKERALAVMTLAIGGKDFAGLAKQYSEGPSKDTGGHLGVFQKGQMVKPFEDKAFSMKTGEISEPVRTQFGWHIIKVEKINEAIVISEKDAKRKIQRKMKEERAKSSAYDDAEVIYDICLDVEELSKAAEEKNMTVTTTGFFSQTSPVKGVANQDKFKSVAFELLEGEISDIHDFGDGYYILQATEKMPERIPELDEIKDRVRADLVKDKRNEKAVEDAGMFLETLKKGASMDTESRRYHLRPVSTGFFKRDDDVPRIGYEKGVSQAAFKLSRKKPLPEKAIKGSNGYYVIRFNSRNEPGTKELTAKEDDIVQRLLEQKKFNAFNAWLSQVKRDSEIEIEETFQNNL
ncbi:MAG: SurA N-terminal domain-containing protein [Deltaproteobacteria bacterium]|nr:SurA N-terminal domain-containing protein [Deltaproteobacteria bacterium]MBW1846008.1 SurA N-terminal domain-containing protein [Deltaproteobacteria bacterium]MBW2364573.1 SurA N-terminal domain-containing protein [Deltaproteobacteria bacterium]